ncbi:MAG: hypothetical protein HC905_24595 [Bacteroidales bacterium]|nr:hypothetical protein [Bacteroidales bacterium]
MKHLLVLFLLSISICGYGQTKVVTGTVLDGAGEPLPGVNVLVEGTTLGVVTDVNGKFEISVPPQNNILVFSFIGYLTEKADVTSMESVNIKMISDVKSLEEIVVVGYGNQRK